MGKIIFSISIIQDLYVRFIIAISVGRIVYENDDHDTWIDFTIWKWEFSIIYRVHKIY